MKDNERILRRMGITPRGEHLPATSECYDTLPHGVSGIDWKHYKHPLPETIYDVYTKHTEKQILFTSR
jgi:hypothetical protein